MKPNEVRRRALLAVAKLSIFASAAGCGGVVTMAPDEAEEAELGPEASATIVPYDVPIHRPAVEEETTVCFDPGEDPVTCCDQALTSAFADDHLFVDPSLATSDELACCSLVFSTLATWDGSAEFPFDWANENNCCVLDPGAAFCSPWGPPMPPAMPKGRAGAEAVA